MISTLIQRTNEILAARPLPIEGGDVIGESREGRSVRALVLGQGDVRVSLLAGCHADEPVGPRLLRHLASCLSSLPANDPMLTRYVGAE